jgi:penicillin-binding protein 1A
VLVVRILDRDGNEIYTGPTEQQQVIPYKSAFFMQQMLMGGLRERGGTSMSLWGYVGQFDRDTEFGGKTGTSNNHSDAWFVGVSPKLVAGAWVGGEYRSIHFRTGQLGQGSRTALPICGYFFQSVLSDPNFKQYHAKFEKPKDDLITEDMYQICQYYYHVADSDSIGIDSLDFEGIEEYQELDADGNPIPKPIEPAETPEANQEPTDAPAGEATKKDDQEI